MSAIFRAKNVVPQRRADAITGVIILVMMAQVILLEPKEQTAPSRDMMRGVVDRIIANVTKGESRRQRRRESSKRNPKDEIHHHGDRNAHRRRHDETARVARII